ncbi:MAG: alpha-1,4-glucan--maltose-1-phosphate maltosyltransferase [Planctomycetota bacterium]|nr:alpha-1,4-glucan--maltose-1-phosphate maltosyltransferase [Planctomycetota bacterium]
MSLQIRKSADPAKQRRTRPPENGRSRPVIENIVPSVDGGRFTIKRSVGENVRVEADAFVDGHARLLVAIRHRVCGASAWQEVVMSPLVNDRWAGEFEVYEVGLHNFSVVAWVDHFGSWQSDLKKRIAAGEVAEIDLETGAELIESAAAARDGDVARSLQGFAALLKSGRMGEAIEAAIGDTLTMLMRQHAPRLFLTEEPASKICVDPIRGRFSSWYELFPRSASNDPEKEGTLRDVESRLDFIARMGFDVLYLPPIHPIGRRFRKGRNNSPAAQPGDVGSPWAIGGAEGGHDAINPKLGTIADFDRLVLAASSRGIDIAMDLAFQCSPDHPYVSEHPEWFLHRPDGTIQYAENPPKKYQDIYPFDFECEDWKGLWSELLRVVLFWHGHGVRAFRVDNPHTKPFPFWEWLIAEVKQRDASVIFLAEAFTRPKVMHRLAKLGFTQSYSYFTWRNDPWSIRQYYTELTRPPIADFFRPNAWPNTPDILPEYLQSGAQAAYIVRVVLAATLCASYGVYGPVFELMEGRPLRAGAEEYLDSEKYEARHWDISRPDSLADLLSRLNRIRRENAALQHDRGLRFHDADNPTVICYSKTHGDNVILVVVNTDPQHTQWANIKLDLNTLGVRGDQPYQLHDLLTEARYRWQGERGLVKLDPATVPAHVFAVRRHIRTEADFDYFT